MMSSPFKTLAWSVLLGVGLVSTSVPVRADTPGASKAVANDSNVLRTTLDNGMRVVIVRETLSPMVTTQITYLAGGYQTPQGFPGTAHALEHMMFRDSKGMTGAQLNEMTGKMGADNNAFTTNDATQYYFVAPSNYLDLLLHIESTRMDGALLTQQDWERERGAIEQEVSRDISQPEFLAFQKAEGILYAGTGYAEDPLGTRSSFGKTTAEDLQTFYKSWYAPNNALLVIVGDVDPQQTLAKVQQLFGKIPKRTLPAHEPVKLQPVKPETIASTTPRGTGSVQFMYRMPGMMDKDNAAAQVLLDVLTNARSSLSQLAVQGKVLSTNAQLQPFSYGGVGVIEVGFPKGGDAKQAQADLDGVINDLLKNGVPADLVEASKQAEIAQAEFNKNSAVTLASAWSQAIAWMGLSTPEEAEDQIRQVTVDDVNRIARQYLKSDERVTVVLTPNENGQRPPDSGGFGGSESFNSNEKLDAPLPEWAAQKLSKLEMPRWTLAPVDMKLDNGIRLIVQPSSISKTVTVVGHIDNNPKLQEATGKEGVARLLDSLFDYGSTTLDRDAFHKALDDISANETGGTDFGVAALSDHFDRAMQLLADNELHPALPQQGFTVQQETLARALAGEMQSPQYKMMKALRAGLLPAGDPDLRLPTPDTIGALKLQDVKDYFAKTYRPDLATIVVVGDVTPEQAKATVERYFGQWKAAGAKPDVVSKPVPVNASGYVVIENSYASQDQVLMGQMLDLTMHNPDRYALQLGNNVLGGNGFASRLMTDIRVKHGYAYGAGSGMHFDRSRSIFFVQYGSDPDKVVPVDGLIRQNLVAMQTTPIKQSELDNARQYEIRSIPVGVSSISSISRALLNWAWHGEPLDQPMVAAKHYLTLTPAQVQAAFKKYLKPENLMQVVQGPTPAKH
ncbi:M16 family metallopeptidase [Dyella nitratireducens]|uniref:Peptidase M16 n=1 Tax=Dyella nitratireducens TaxID=1849580 RepID=A0ABQ1GN67_9GAMM|nr:pitrilysin family protein [Dyella nitratireducens]GGA46803.1 peptidase M16 [Dyella nitratireducens]GLQ41499.1 peptidase M16 [Dyella nitratireducens]